MYYVHSADLEERTTVIRLSKNDCHRASLLIPKRYLIIKINNIIDCGVCGVCVCPFHFMNGSVTVQYGYYIAIYVHI